MEVVVLLCDKDAMRLCHVYVHEQAVMSCICARTSGYVMHMCTNKLLCHVYVHGQTKDEIICMYVCDY